MTTHALAMLSGASMIGLAGIGTYATRSDHKGSARPFGALACIGSTIFFAAAISATFTAVLS